MGVMQRLGRWMAGKPAPSRRAFAAAKASRLLGDWSSQNVALDQDLRTGLASMRARSRELSLNNPYAKKFLYQQVPNNVIGPDGVSLQVKSRDPSGALDNIANNLIERAWKQQSKRANWDVTGRFSRAESERAFIKAVATDGESIVRKARGFGNDTGYAIQILDSDRLPIDLNHERRGASPEIVMGVELDEWRAPAYYHLDLGRHPSDTYDQGSRGRARVPASDIIHAFVPLRSEQQRGVPWMHAAMVELNHLGAYKEAAIVAARVGAAKVMWFRGAQEYTGDDEDDQKNVIMDAEPGSPGQLPPETEIVDWNPDYPHEQYGSFNKAILQGVASGFGSLYNTTANDLEGVNFSSMRGGVLDERDGWMTLQNWVIESFDDLIFSDWLKYQMTTNSMGVFGQLPLSKFAKFNAPEWQARRWSWVDPLRDMQANKLGVELRTLSPSEIIRQRGRDPDEVLDEIADFQRKLDERGIPASEVMSAMDTNDDQENISPNG